METTRAEAHEICFRLGLEKDGAVARACFVCAHPC